MKIENLIQIVQNLLDVNAVDFEFKVYDSLKMDNVQLDVNKVNGLARITTGSIDPILNLGQSSATMVVEFIYPYERLEAVRETLLAVSQNSAGLVVPNNTLDASLTGSTGVIISYPTQGNYFNGTMGETARSRLICYFDINEKSVLSNDIKLAIQNGYYEANKDLKGKYFKLVDGNYVEVNLPEDYTANTIYYNQVNRLPHGYEELEYIEGTGTQYINSEIKGKSGMEYWIKFIPTTATQNYTGLIGCGRLTTALTLELFGNSSYKQVYWSYGSHTEHADNAWTVGESLEVRYTFEDGNQELDINNVVKSLATQAGTIDNNDDIYVMGCNTSGSTPSSIKLQECEIWDGVILVAHYLPCKKTSNGHIGVYDLVEGKFLENAGTGTFVAGRITVEEVNSTLTSDQAHIYYTKAGETYTKVNLPTNYTANTIYYVPNWENIPYYKYIITRHRLSTTNKYNNNKEMQTVNDGQSIDFSLAVPSIKGSVINSIKNDMLTGDNIGKTFNFRVIEEDGAEYPKYFENMIASGDFSYEIVPGNVLLFKILFVYKRM